MGLVLAAGSLANVAGAILWGHLADKSRHRSAILVASFLGCAIALVFAGAASEVSTYLLWIGAWNFFVAASPPISNVLVMERARSGDWAEAISRFNLVGNYGWILGLLTGAAGFASLEILGAHPSALFYVAAAFFVLSAVVLRLTVPERGFRASLRDYFQHMLFEKRMPEHSGSTGRLTQWLPSTRALRALRDHSRNFSGTLGTYYFATLLFFIGFTSFYTAFPIFLRDDVHLVAGSIFLVYAASSVASTFMYRRSGAIIERGGVVKMQLIALAYRGAMFPVMILVPTFSGGISFLIVALLNASLGLAWALINVTMTLAVPAMAPSQYKGEAIGLLNAVIGVATVVGSYLGGATASEFGYAATFVLAGLLVITGLKLVQLSGYEQNPLLT